MNVGKSDVKLMYRLLDELIRGEVNIGGWWEEW